MVEADSERLDAVLLKVTLTGPEVDLARTGFHLSGDRAQRFRVYFWELPSWGRRLALLDAGLILRLRAYHDGSGEVAVTLRPCRRQRLGARWTGRRTSGEHEFRIEEHWAGGRHVLAASLVTSLSRRGADQDPGRAGGLAGLLSPLQREFLTECADLRPHLDDLRLLGPVNALRWTLDRHDLTIAAEHWTIPDTEIDVLELAVRAAPADAPLVQPALTALVRRHGLDPDAVTTTRTRIVLDHLATLTRGPHSDRR